MARLYGEIFTDRPSRVNKHFIANENFEITLFYGSRDDSKKFARIRVSWERGTEKPIIEVLQNGS